MKISNNEKGQALVEYAIIVFFCMLIFMLAIQQFLTSLDNYVQGIYYLMFQSYP